MSLAWMADAQTAFVKTVRDSRAESIRRFLSELRAKYDPRNDQDFRVAVRTCISYQGLDAQQIADACRVSLGTVSRWQNGKVLPPPAIRKSVAEELEKLLLKLLQDSAFG